MKYPKKSETEFIQFSENDCRQINVHKGTKYNYWFIEPSIKAIKLKIGILPEVLINKKLNKITNF